MTRMRRFPPRYPVRAPVGKPLGPAWTDDAHLLLALAKRGRIWGMTRFAPATAASARAEYQSYYDRLPRTHGGQRHGLRPIRVSRDDADDAVAGEG